MKKKYKLWTHLPYPKNISPPDKFVAKQINSWPLFYLKNIRNAQLAVLIKSPNNISWDQELIKLKEILKKSSKEKQHLRVIDDLSTIFEWLTLLSYLSISNNLGVNGIKRLITTILLTIHDVAVTTWVLKFKYNVARPVQLDKKLINLIPTPLNPSYPSGHASIAGALSAVLGDFFPKEAALINKLAIRTAKGRVYAGVHFPIDIEEGLVLGHTLGLQIIKKVKGN